MDASARRKRGRKTATGSGAAEGQAAVAEYRVMSVDAATALAAVDDRAVRSPIIMRIKQPADDAGQEAADVATTSQQDGERQPRHVATLDPCAACFWCCHRPHGPPVGLPVRVTRAGRFAVTGTFCSIECAAAFLFNSRELHVSPWSSYAMLNAMARAAGAPVPVREAPSRLCLRMFGGWMDIDEFRAGATRSSPLPPSMVSVSQVMDDASAAPGAPRDPSAFVPLDHDRVMKAKQNLMRHTSGAKRSIHSRMHLVTPPLGAP